MTSFVAVLAQNTHVGGCIKINDGKKKSCFERWYNVGCLKKMLKELCMTPAQKWTSLRKPAQRRMSPRKKSGEGQMTSRAARATTKKGAAVKTVRGRGIKAKKRAAVTSLTARAGTRGKRSMAIRPAEKDMGALLTAECSLV